MSGRVNTLCSLPDIRLSPPAPASVATGESGRGHTPSTLQSSSDTRLLTTGGDPSHGTPGALGLHSESITARAHSTPSVTVAPVSGRHTPPSLPPLSLISSHPHTITQATPPGELTITSLLSSVGRSAAHPNQSTSGSGRLLHVHVVGS